MRPVALLCSIPLALLLACGGEESKPTSAPMSEAPTPTVPPVTPQPETTPPASTPSPTASAACAVPAGSLRGDAKAGELTYNQFCTLCHGAEKPPVQPPPADHHDCKYMGSLSDEHLYKVICGGGGAVGKAVTMPSWGAALPPDSIKNVIAHLRSFCPS